MMLPFAPLLLLPFLHSTTLALTTLPPPAAFVNTAIARTVELGGALTQTTTQYNVKSLSASPGDYFLALAGEGEEEPDWWEVSLGGKVLDVHVLKDAALGSAPTVKIPVGMSASGETATISLTSERAHVCKPLPAEIEQRDPQYLLWKTNSSYVDSWYPADVERVKIRSPTSNILTHASIPSSYTRDSTVTKASSTVTLGPFHSLPATLGGKVANPSFEVHYESKEPVMGIRTLRRSAEVSHWGANLNVQDDIALVNMGPKLKGHFSRLAHQQSKFHASSPAQILTSLALRLPPQAHSPYYYDTIGNVSTSHFRPGSVPATAAKSLKVRTSPRVVDGVLDLRPRYPLLGGWNYSFTVGWDLPLGDVVKKDEAAGKYVLGVPFLTGWRDLAVGEVEMKIVLPEGARDVEVYTPFQVDSIEHSTHKTYLDSTGRHMITLKKARCTEHHAQTVYVTYTYPLSAHFQKPLTVAGVVGGLFVLLMGLRRVQYGIDK